MTTQAVLDADHNRLNAALEACGAVGTTDDGFRYIDESVAPGFLGHPNSVSQHRVT